MRKIIIAIAVFAPVAIVTAVILAYWFRNPELSQMGVFLQWWHWLVGVSLYTAVTVMVVDRQGGWVK